MKATEFKWSAAILKVYLETEHQILLRQHVARCSPTFWEPGVSSHMLIPWHRGTGWTESHQRPEHRPDIVLTGEKGKPSHVRKSIWYSEGHGKLGGRGEGPKHHAQISTLKWEKRHEGQQQSKRATRQWGVLLCTLPLTSATLHKMR